MSPDWTTDGEAPKSQYGGGWIDASRLAMGRARVFGKDPYPDQAAGRAGRGALDGIPETQLTVWAWRAAGISRSSRTTAEELRGREWFCEAAKAAHACAVILAIAGDEQDRQLGIQSRHTLDNDILPHLAGIRFGRPGGSEAWRRP